MQGAHHSAQGAGVSLVSTALPFFTLKPDQRKAQRGSCVLGVAISPSQWSRAPRPDPAEKG